MNVSKSNILRLAALTLTMLAYQNCDIQRYRSVSGGAEAYLRANIADDFENRFVIEEDSIIEASADPYVDRDNRVKYTIVTQPTLGTITSFNPSTGRFIYDTNQDAYGVDYFEVVAEIENVYVSEAWRIEIEITPSNDNPVALVGTFTSNGTNPIEGTLKAYEPDNEELTFSIFRQPVNGDVVILDAKTGAFRYTPNANSTGTDSFSFRVRDATGISNTANVSIVAPTSNVALSE